MHFVIDTNIVFGLLNESDRLHLKAVELIRKIEGNLFLLHEVIDEVCRVFPDKIYDAIKPLIDLYRSLIPLTPTESEITKRENETIRELLGKHPRMINFYKFALETARKHRAKKRTYRCYSWINGLLLKN